MRQSKSSSPMSESELNIEVPQRVANQQFQASYEQALASAPQTGLAMPLARWDDNDSEHPNLVWWTRLDGQWQIEVHRLAPFIGLLYIFKRNNHLEVARHAVSIIEDAIYGVDIRDIHKWKSYAISFVDHQKPVQMPSA